MLRVQQQINLQDVLLLACFRGKTIRGLSTNLTNHSFKLSFSYFQKLGYLFASDELYFYHPYACPNPYEILTIFRI